MKILFNYTIEERTIEFYQIYSIKQFYFVPDISVATSKSFSFIVLDREVDAELGAFPLTLSTMRGPYKIWKLGHPSGLPMKVASGYLLNQAPGDVDDGIIFHNIDTFQGDVGSPIFRGGQVIGIQQGEIILDASKWNNDYIVDDNDNVIEKVEAIDASSRATLITSLAFNFLRPAIEVRVVVTPYNRD